ncbi:hypothetical protein [Streptomyces sp. CB01580]|uniref:hypothetical protein n=1 Tax=Streptomyces sp. CB01580 TaxID=1703933 RepID=UPI00093C992A
MTDRTARTTHTASGAAPPDREASGPVLPDRTGLLQVPGATLRYEVRGQGLLLLMMPGGSAGRVDPFHLRTAAVGSDSDAGSSRRPSRSRIGYEGRRRRGHGFGPTGGTANGP